MILPILSSITATYIISGHYIGVIVAVIQAVYGLPAKCVGYMCLVWAERRNNTHNTAFKANLCLECTRDIISY